MGMSLGIIIPARYQSSRLPGKPLIDLNGKTMIQRTWERCCLALPREKVYVATDSDQIASYVEHFGGNVVRTESTCLTGTDRVAQANQKIGLDIVINVQGDEPIIDPNDIKKVIEFAKLNPFDVINGYSAIQKKEEYFSLSIPKLAKSESDQLLYMSRAPIPGCKDGTFKFAFKQICVYAFPKKALEAFTSATVKSPFEGAEDIEILRFLELDFLVKLVELSGTNIAVDTEGDVEKVKIHLTMLRQKT